MPKSPFNSAPPPPRSEPSAAFRGKPRPPSFDRLRKLANEPFIQLSFFVLFVLAVVAILTSGFRVRDVSLDESQIGQQALREIEATRDFVFVEVDVKASEQARERVARETPPVYDWNESLADTLADDVHQAFDGMRGAIASSIRERAMLNQPSLPPDQGDSGDDDVPPQESEAPVVADMDLIAMTPAPVLTKLAAEHREEYFNPTFPSPIKDEVFNEFANRGFSPSVESMITSSVHEAMNHLIVPDGRVFEEERENGLYVRRVRDGKPLIEYHISNLRGRLKNYESLTTVVLRDVAQERFGDQPPDLYRALYGATAAIVRPNTTLNEVATLTKRETSSQAIAQVIVREPFRKGQVIVAEGDIITPRHVRIYDRMIAEEAFWDPTQIMLGLVLFSLTLFVVIYLYARHNIARFDLKPKDIVFASLTLLTFLLLARLGKALSYTIAEQLTLIPAEAWLFSIPVAGAGILVRLMLRSEHAISFSMIYALLVGVIMDQLLFYSALTLIGCLVGASMVRQVKHRLALMWSGLAVGMVNVIVVLGYLLYRGDLLHTESLFILLMSFCGGLASGFFVSAIHPVFEATFGYTTDIKLLELSNLNHPLLRELILRAPGSYQHSMMVGSLSEAAAENIGCNSLLARVGAYYHDVGKAKNPGYFAENQKYGENPHDKLKPNMSALIIKAHVKDGIELARAHRLPKEIIDFIEQHHGTSLIRYFYHKAKEMEDPDIPEVDEKDYRYPGPRPQSRETAICLLADGIEAASRAMPDKTPARLKGLVHNMINKAFTDGQLDECDLTLKDLNAIAQAFIRILNAIYHYRPEYPDQKKSAANKDGRATKNSNHQANGSPLKHDGNATKKERAAARKDNEKSGAEIKPSREIEKPDESRHSDTGHGAKSPRDRGADSASAQSR